MDPYIVPEALDPNHRLTARKLENLARAHEAYEARAADVPALPSKVTFQTTERCNLRCPHCQIPWAEKKRSMAPRMLDLLREQLLDDLIELHPTNLGEPFAWPHFRRLCGDMAEHGVLLDLTTNGTLMDVERMEWVAPIARDIKVSMDGATPATFERLRLGASFERVTENTRALVQRLRRVRVRRPTVAFQMTLMRQNVDELPALVRLASDLGVDRVKAYHLFSFRPENDSWSLVEELERYERRILPRALALGEELGVELQLAEPSGGDAHSLRARTCFLPWHETWVDVDGSILACHSHGGQVAGTLDDLPAAWNGSLYRRIRAGLGAGEGVGACRGCGMNFAKPDEHAAVPFDASSFLSGGSTGGEPVRWSGRMRQFDRRARRSQG